MKISDIITLTVLGGVILISSVIINDITTAVVGGLFTLSGVFGIINYLGGNKK